MSFRFKQRQKQARGIHNKAFREFLAHRLLSFGLLRRSEQVLIA